MASVHAPLYTCSRLLQGCCMFVSPLDMLSHTLVMTSIPLACLPKLHASGRNVLNLSCKCNVSYCLLATIVSIYIFFTYIPKLCAKDWLWLLSLSLLSHPYALPRYKLKEVKVYTEHSCKGGGICVYSAPCTLYCFHKAAEYYALNETIFYSRWANELFAVNYTLHMLDYTCKLLVGCAVQAGLDNTSLSETYKRCSIHLALARNVPVGSYNAQAI